MGIDIIFSIVNIIGFIVVVIIIVLFVKSVKEDVKEEDAEWNEFVIKTKKDNEDFKLKHKEFMEKFNAQTPILFAEAQKEHDRQKAEDAVKPLSNDDAEHALREFEKLCERIEASCNRVLETCNEIQKQSENNK